MARAGFAKRCRTTKPQPAGTIAAYCGGKVDTLIMRTVDALSSVPSLLFVIVIMTFLRTILANPSNGFTAALARLDTCTGGLIGIFIGIGLINGMPAARLVRGQAVSLISGQLDWL
jgi:oligopeptide transport system permease protein